MTLVGRTITPMKAASGELPVGDGWVHEIKWDGMRAVAFIEGGQLRLQTTNLKDATNSFPELEPLAEALADYDSVVLDGEIVAFDAEGRVSFRQMQHRMHVADRGDASRRAVANPATFIVFDLLHLNGNDTFALPLKDRRRLLEQVLEPGPNWQLSTLYTEGAADLLAVVTEQQLEGLVSKREGSIYEPGKRSRQWRKVKPRLRQEFVVGGWITGDGNRSNSLGSVLVGWYDETGFRFAGRVGSGFTGADLTEWMGLLGPLARPDSPFVDQVPPKPGRAMHWVEPELVVEVAYGEWDAEGHLRHPSYLGRRTDKAARDVVLEQPR